MKAIYLVRHSIAETVFSKPDFERCITEEGYTRIEEQINKLKRKKDSIDLIICSSARRTAQTAKALQMGLGVEQKIKDFKWLYEDYPSYQFIDFIKAQNNSYNTIMIVAHNPSISSMASLLSDSKSYEFYPGGILKLNFNTSEWRSVNIRMGKKSYF